MIILSDSDFNKIGKHFGKQCCPLVCLMFRDITVSTVEALLEKSLSTVFLENAMSKVQLCRVPVPHRHGQAEHHKQHCVIRLYVADASNSASTSRAISLGHEETSVTLGDPPTPAYILSLLVGESEHAPSTHGRRMSRQSTAASLASHKAGFNLRDLCVLEEIRVAHGELPRVVQILLSAGASQPRLLRPPPPEKLQVDGLQSAGESDYDHPVVQYTHDEKSAAWLTWGQSLTKTGDLKYRLEALRMPSGTSLYYREANAVPEKNHRFKMPLINLPSGLMTFRLQARNEVGDSQWSFPSQQVFCPGGSEGHHLTGCFSCAC